MYPEHEPLAKKRWEKEKKLEHEQDYYTMLTLWEFTTLHLIILVFSMMHALILEGHHYIAHYPRASQSLRDTARYSWFNDCGLVPANRQNSITGLGAFYSTYMSNDP